jgi:hypothetical protein
MADSKYGKYIITEPKVYPRDPNRDKDAMPPDWRTGVVSTDGERPKGAFISSGGWIWKAYPDQIWVRAHTHDFDETLNFFGTNPDDVTDLCGEIELWLEDEKFLLTKSCTVFLPKGMKHCPITIKRVDRPIFSFLCATVGKYNKSV